MSEHILSENTVAHFIAAEINVKPSQIEAAIQLLDEGSTVPFIARYRKEATQGLDDGQLRTLDTRLTYLRELLERKTTVLKSIEDQGKLTPELKAKIEKIENKTELEEVYLPFKPKRRTKGEIAKEAGLEPLALNLWQHPETDPEQAALNYINAEKGIADSKAALDGAKYILMEKFAEDADLLQKVRSYLQKNAHIKATLVAGKENEGAKYKDYFAHSELLSSAPSHRALAMFRGRNEGILQVNLDADPEKEEGDRHSYCETIIADHVGLSANKLAGKAGEKFLSSVVQWTWRIKIMMYMETELFNQLRERSDAAAIKVFADNLKDLLMAAPAGAKCTMGLDPGLRTGVKVAIVDATGKLVATSTIFPHVPQNQWDKSLRTLGNLCKQHKVKLISIGNGTGSRETDKLVAELIKDNAELGIHKVMVSEAGASVYSASELAASEFPDLDVSLRGAVSIARRLQDPLAELVKIEPKAIGVGQYQHDVSQSQLSKSLDAVVEDCVNGVGVDLNMASPALLSHVSGLNKTLAQNIVKYRDENGAFKNRRQLLEVSRLGNKAFEQSAGFLRINASQGDNPLDSSAVHPETYPLVKKMIAKLTTNVESLIGNEDAINQLEPQEFVDEQFGLPTVRDIIDELKKPGRDPRPEFKTAQFKEGIEEIKDLKPGMILEGVVSNVANFGAFVDVGVHQDGLVHISSMTNKFISDPREIVKAGDIVKVKVMEVDIERKRISFTMRLDDKPTAKSNGQGDKKPDARKGKPQSRSKPQGNRQASFGGNAAMGNAFAEAFAKAKKD
ncbi:Tex family protein [Alteromonas sp. a30]|uniref:Tex family protein n=1 Tax=Alteromonas sp. a30 TaxID=2730917 RepID=UPI00228181CE|nr:Tex family protein [Alteromonas sp. a30]MCY7295630.1 RNA-binding transcriptional accessory protein [Alteromonas sp. a30]